MQRLRTSSRTLVCGVLTVVLLGGTTPSPSPPAASGAQTAAVELAKSRLDTMLRTGHADPTWFSAAFLNEVPASKVDDVIATLTKALGAYQSVESTPTRFIAHFAKGTDDVLIHLDADNKIDGLLFKPPVMAASSLDDALRALRKSPGTLSYVIVEGRSERAALNPSMPLAVGSTFKLAVLNAVRDQIAGARRHWSDVVPLAESWKSLPSGELQKWPGGTPITLASYAAQMISISDNTAADALIHIVGPRALQPYADGNEPFLTTREAFMLISDPHADLRGAYLSAATAQARAAVLREVDTLPLPAVTQVLSAPLLGIEWHYNVRRLCELMTRVADLPLMSINPGVAEPGAFRRVAYKGGSGPGALNLTTAVTTHRGTNLCFSATLNSQHEIAESDFEAAYGGVLQQLAAR